MSRTSMRSPLGTVLGLGSARKGVEDWLLERVSAAALVPLTLWFAISAVKHAADNYATLVAWLRMPGTTTLMTLLLIVLFQHTALGLQVVIEDYVHSRIKLPALVGMRLGCLAMAVAGFVATLKVAFGA